MWFKTIVRKFMSYKRNCMLFYDCDKYSKRIANTLYELDEWKSAGAINIYENIGNEVSTKDIIIEAFGTKVIYHPAKKPEHNSSDIDLVIVPGVVFDVNMARYGRGFGYYDRFLSKLSGVKVIALAYDFQILSHKKELKLEDWDIKMDYIITEKRIIQKAGYIFYN